MDVKIKDWGDRVCMTVSDDGKSFNVDRMLNSRSGTHLGLLGMRERVEMVAGTFCVDSKPGHGTTVRVEIPLTKPHRQPPKTLRNASIKCA